MTQKVMQLFIDETEAESLISALEAAIDCCGEEASIFKSMGSDKSVDCCLQQQKRYKALKFKIEKERERA